MSLTATLGQLQVLLSLFGFPPVGDGRESLGCDLLRILATLADCYGRSKSVHQVRLLGMVHHCVLLTCDASDATDPRSTQTVILAPKGS